jgi:hypothetical protein
VWPVVEPDDGCETSRLDDMLIEVDDGVEVTVAELRRVTVYPGDVLVLTLPDGFTAREADQLRREWVEAFPGTMVLLLPAGAELTTASNA